MGKVLKQRILYDTDRTKYKYAASLMRQNSGKERRHINLWKK